MIYITRHAPPDEKDIAENINVEPEGERLRQELTDWLNKNGIVSILLDTEKHCVEVESATLPPKIKPVLSKWGCIYVENAVEVESTRITSTILDVHPIPTLPYEMADLWHQPSREAIRIEGDQAFMTRKTLKYLKEYSTSFPTGVYPGKMWKRRSNEHDEWLLCWYGISNRGPEYCSNECRKVVLVDGRL